MRELEEVRGVEPAVPVSELVRSTLDRFTPSERKVARTLLANYPLAGLGPAAQLARDAEVSGPTVVRFVTRMGFTGHEAFRAAVAREAESRLGSPLEQYARSVAAPSGPALFAYAAETFGTMTAATFAELREHETTRAVGMLSDPGRRLHLAGGRFSHVLADYLGLHLQMLRPGVRVVPDDEMGRIDLRLASGRRDVLVLFDYRRHDEDSVALARAMRGAGASVLLLTDPGLSPAADLADVVLTSRVEAPSPFDSLVPAMALVEALVAAVADALGEQGWERVERVEGQRRSPTLRKESFKNIS